MHPLRSSSLIYLKKTGWGNSDFLLLQDFSKLRNAPTVCRIENQNAIRESMKKIAGLILPYQISSPLACVFFFSTYVQTPVLVTKSLCSGKKERKRDDVAVCAHEGIVHQVRPVSRVNLYKIQFAEAAVIFVVSRTKTKER